MDHPLQAQLDAILNHLPPDVTFGCHIRVAGFPVASWNDGVQLRTASIGKVFLLVATSRAVQDGTVTLSEVLHRSSFELVGESGLWRHLAVGRLPLSDVALLVGGLSDNLATNVLLDRIGLASVESCQMDLGMKWSGLLDRVRDTRTDLDPPALSVGTASELAVLMDRLDSAALPWPNVAGQVLEWLSLDADLSMVASAFGLDPLSHQALDRGLLLRHKTGSDAGVKAEIGVLRGTRAPVAYAAIANWPVDGQDRRDLVLDTMRSIGLMVRRAGGGSVDG